MRRCDMNTKTITTCARVCVIVVYVQDWSHNFNVLLSLTFRIINFPSQKWFLVNVCQQSLMNSILCRVLELKEEIESERCFSPLSTWNWPFKFLGHFETMLEICACILDLIYIIKFETLTQFKWINMLEYGCNKLIHWRAAMCELSTHIEIQ